MDLKQPATILIILGVTDDLAAKKILPALFNLHSKAALAKHFKIIGFGRKPHTTETFKSYLSEVITKRLPDSREASIASFATSADYVRNL